MTNHAQDITWYPLVFERTINQNEKDALQAGVKAVDMDQRWNVYYDGGVYIFARSWTNQPNFKFTIEGDRVSEVYTSIADPAGNEDFYKNMLDTLILMLGNGDLNADEVK